jgi:adenosylhomocysteine nucleosidase
MSDWHPGIVVGLAAEARIARPLGGVEIGGGTPEGARQAAECLVAGGATVLISFGLAGGLDPALKAGALVVPAGLADEGTVHRADPALLARLGGATAACSTTAPAIVATAAAKAALHHATGASAVDLESGAVALVAARHGLPFAILRAISDPAATSLPPAALVSLKPGGHPDLRAIIASLAAHPAQIPALAALALATGRALRALRRRVRDIASAPPQV